jgi:hypothetical protein
MDRVDAGLKNEIKHHLLYSKHSMFTAPFFESEEYELIERFSGYGNGYERHLENNVNSL